MPATSFFVRMPLMIGIAFSAMVVACGAVAGPHRQGRPPSEFARMWAGWNRRSDADSRPALACYIACSKRR